MVDKVLEEELKNRKDVIKPVTFRHEPIAPTDPESDSDTEEVVSKLPKRLKHIKFTKFFKLTPHAGTSSESRGVKRKRAPFAIKFITYLLFRFEGQKGLHSPVSDCHLTMISYFYDYEYLEDQMKRAKERSPIPSRKNYLSYIIPPNLKMSNLVKKINDKYKSWPRRPLNKYQY